MLCEKVHAFDAQLARLLGDPRKPKTGGLVSPQLGSSHRIQEASVYFFKSTAGGPAFRTVLSLEKNGQATTEGICPASRTLWSWK